MDTLVYIFLGGSFLIFSLTCFFVHCWIGTCRSCNYRHLFPAPVSTAPAKIRPVSVRGKHCIVRPEDCQRFGEPIYNQLPATRRPLPATPSQTSYLTKSELPVVHSPTSPSHLTTVSTSGSYTNPIYTSPAPSVCGEIKSIKNSSEEGQVSHKNIDNLTSVTDKNIIQENLEDIISQEEIVQQPTSDIVGKVESNKSRRHNFSSFIPV